MAMMLFYGVYKKQQYFKLNSAAFRIWQLLYLDGNTETAIEIILQEYDVDAHILRKDLDELLNGLREMELVRMP